MSRYMIVLLCLVVLGMSVGCVSYGALATQNVTNVELSEKNYEVVKLNATGTDFGFTFLGFIPINPCSLTKAMEALNNDAQIRIGDSRALVNVVKERRYLYLILFSLPRVAVRADVVEFTSAD